MLEIPAPNYHSSIVNKKHTEAQHSLSFLMCCTFVEYGNTTSMCQEESAADIILTLDKQLDVTYFVNI